MSKDVGCLAERPSQQDRARQKRAIEGIPPKKEAHPSTNAIRWPQPSRAPHPPFLTCHHHQILCLPTTAHFPCPHHPPLFPSPSPPFAASARPDPLRGYPRGEVGACKMGCNGGQYTPASPLTPHAPRNVAVHRWGCQREMNAASGQEVGRKGCMEPCGAKAGLAERRICTYTRQRSMSNARSSARQRQTWTSLRTSGPEGDTAEGRLIPRHASQCLLSLPRPPWLEAKPAAGDATRLPLPYKAPPTQP